jgi:hypothetical protein
MSDYDIEKGVDLPKKSRSGHTKYPFLRMEIGDSVVFPLSKVMTIRAAIVRVQNERGKKFATRKIDDNNFRVWRVQ